MSNQKTYSRFLGPSIDSAADLYPIPGGRGVAARTINQELAIRVAADCADYVEANMPSALQFTKREDLWNYVWGKKNTSGLIAEFGVWNGYSINCFAEKTSDVIYGFDSFVGLHEDWTGTDQGKGGFDRGGRVTACCRNVRLFKGWFHETLPGFLAEHRELFVSTSTSIAIHMNRLIAGSGFDGGSHRCRDCYCVR